MKKLISVLLLFVILFCSMSTTAFAFSESFLEKNGVMTESNALSTQIKDETVTRFDDQNTNVVQPKVKLDDVNDSIRLGTNDELQYELQFSIVDDFDSVVISFASTQGVTLDSYKSITMEYNESIAPISLSFQLNEYSSKYDVALNYQDVDFEKIIVYIDVIEENKIVQTEKTTITALFTNHGTFLTRYGEIFAYDTYITYLFKNKLIEDNDVKDVYKKMTEIQEVKEDQENMGFFEESFEPNELITYFNTETQSVASIAVSEYASVNKYGLNGINNNSEISLMATSTSGTINSPSIRITRTITALSDGDQLRVYGYVYWTGINGTRYPARNIEVAIMDEDAVSDETRKTVSTNNSGYYSATIDNQNDILENGCDIYIRVNLSNNDFEIVSNAVTGVFSNGYYITTTVTDNVTTSQPEATYVGVGEDHYRSLSVHQAMVVGYYYYDKMNDGDTNTISVKYPHDGGSDSTSLIDYVRISYDDYCDWDVILHELGHQVASQINVDALFFGDHSLDDNLMELHGKSTGIKGAWSEGWATYFSLAAQKYFNSKVATISNIPNVADEAYTDLRFDNSGNYHAEIHHVYSTYVGCGEGNEAAVSYVLFYLVYRAGLTHQELWNVAKESSCNCFSEFIETLYNNVDSSFYTDIGILLEEQNIANAPDVRTSIFSRNTPGTFYWDPVDTTDGTSGSYQYHEDAVITFFDEEYNMVMESPIYASNSGTYGVSINSALWTLLGLEITGDSFYWCIATSQNDNPGTGPYYSSFHKAYFSEDITAIGNTNSQYNGYLNAYDDVVYEFVAPTSGYYTFFSIGDVDVNVTVYLSTKLEGSDITDDDGGNELNFLYNTYLSAGATVYLKVGGYEDAMGAFNVVAIRCAAKALNTSTYMTIIDTSGVWFKFVAPASGSYTFYTTGDIDVYGELFEYPVPDGSAVGRLIYNDDAGVDNNFLFTYDLDQNETVYVRVRGYSSSTSGTCTFCIVPTHVVSSTDTSYSDVLEANGYRIYKFTAPTAGEYTFFTTGDIDTYMDLFNEPVLNRTTNTNRLGYNDDGGVLRNSLITYSLSRGQTVFIRVKGYSTTTSGDYCLAIVKSTTIETLNIGYSGDLDNGSMLWYTFTAPQNGYYTIYTTSSIDTYGDAFSFFAPDGGMDYLIDSNDDDEEVDFITYDFRLVLSMTAGQTIYIRVRGYDIDTTGTFTLYAEEWEN